MNKESKWKRCPECKLKIRGKNHSEGWDHKRRAGSQDKSS